MRRHQTRTVEQELARVAGTAHELATRPEEQPEPMLAELRALLPEAL